MTVQELHKKWNKDVLTYDEMVEYNKDWDEHYRENGFSETFHSPYTDFNQHNGKPFEVLSLLSVEELDYDFEKMPMWKIKIDDEVFDAYPEEICEHYTLD